MESPDPHRLEDESEFDPPYSPRKLPDDLPTSLDDRRAFSGYGGETEIYDGWQGKVNGAYDCGLALSVSLWG